MHFAMRSELGDGDGSESYHNPYAFMARAAMAKAGVPEGADVMIVGHSFGAYTAVEMARHASFNGGTYNVTNVVAAGADVSWMADGVPGSTDLLIINNRLDAVVIAEDVASAYGNKPQGHGSEVRFAGGPMVGGMSRGTT